MHQGQRALDALVGQVGEEVGELGGGEHALVDQGAAAERGEVGALLGWKVVFDPLAHDEQLAVCLLYTSDAADERSSVDLGGRRIIKKKKN